jgi:hypothetical protein
MSGRNSAIGEEGRNMDQLEQDLTALVQKIESLVERL